MLMLALILASDENIWKKIMNMFLNQNESFVKLYKVVNHPALKNENYMPVEGREKKEKNCYTEEIVE